MKRIRKASCSAALDPITLDFYLSYDPVSDITINDAVFLFEMFYYKKMFMLEASEVTDMQQFLNTTGETVLGSSWNTILGENPEFSIDLDNIPDDLEDLKRPSQSAMTKHSQLKKVLAEFFKKAKEKYTP